jgi:hypothetical protein
MNTSLLCINMKERQIYKSKQSAYMEKVLLIYPVESRQSGGNFTDHRSCSNIYTNNK